MEQPSSPTATSHHGCNTAALVLAVLAVGASLWLSIGMGLKACPLCLYQRTFVMGALAVLVVSRLLGSEHSAVGGLLALPLATAAAAVAAFHEYLEFVGKLECPGGLLGIGTAPQQSLMLLVVLWAVLVCEALAGETHREKSWRAAAPVVIGLLLAVGAIASAPPMPPAPSKPYEQPLDMCRPPFRAA